MGDRLAAVDRLLERLEDVLPADHDHRIDPLGEQRRDRLSRQAVALALELAHPDEVRRQLAVVVQRPDRVEDRAAALCQDVRELLRLRHRRLDPVEPERVGHLLGVVDDVVDRVGERVDLGRRERRLDPVLVQPVKDVVGEPIAVLLLLQDLAREVAPLGVVREELVEGLRGPARIAGGFLDQVEQPAVRGVPA